MSHVIFLLYVFYNIAMLLEAIFAIFFDQKRIIKIANISNNFFTLIFQYASVRVRILTKTASDIVSFKVRNRVIG